VLASKYRKRPRKARPSARFARLPGATGPRNPLAPPPRRLRPCAIPLAFAAKMAGKGSAIICCAQLNESVANGATDDFYPLRSKKSENLGAELVAAAKGVSRRDCLFLLDGFRSCRFAEGMIHRSVARSGSLPLKPWLIRGFGRGLFLCGISYHLKNL